MYKTSSVKVYHRGRGYQTHAVYLNPSNGEPVAYRAGGVRFAEPLTANDRWRHATPLSDGETYNYGPDVSSAKDLTGYAAECPQPRKDFRKRQNEDCLMLNVWMPAGEPPKGGWPVFFYIYGGFLQWGTPNGESPVELFASTSVKCVVVAPTYRLNALGFLCCDGLRVEAKAQGFLNTNSSQDMAGRTCVGNLGFWDLRLALEWTAANVHLYNGDAGNVTVGGLSAGAYSTFHQLAYENLSLDFAENVPSTLPKRKGSRKRLIRRVVMWSNGCGLQPKPPHEYQSHFEALVSALPNPPAASNNTLAYLRSVPVADIIKSVDTIPVNAFRASTDSVFIQPDLMSRIRDGTLGYRLGARGIRVMAGEVPDEFNSYRSVGPPKSYPDLVKRLAVEYPQRESQWLAEHYCPASSSSAGISPRSNGERPLPRGFESWQDVFGQIYADVQVHVSQRGLLACLARDLPAGIGLLRYKIEWLPDNKARRKIPQAMGVPHGSDMLVWWAGNEGGPVKADEMEIMKEWVEPWGGFLEGKGEAPGQGLRDVGWGTGEIGQMRVLKKNGEIRTEVDKGWKAAVRTFHGAATLGKESKL